MKRLGISVEGPTEREFVQTVLRPHLMEVGWSMCQAVVLGRQGGSVAMPQICTDLRLLAGRFDCVSTLYDLYGFQDRAGRDSAGLQEAIKEKVGNVKHLVPYVQRYEFEALLLADLDVVHRHVAAAPAEARRLRRAIDSISPEEINDGFDTCPSRRLRKAFPRFEKFRHGPAIAREIGLATIRARCPRFDAWLKGLEQHPLLTAAAQD